MDSSLSDNLNSLKQEFGLTSSPVETGEGPVTELEIELPPAAEEPVSEPVAVVEEVGDDFTMPAPPVVEPLYRPSTQPLAAETVRVQNMKLSEFMSWLAEDQQGMDNMIKTLSAEMALAGFAAPPTHDLTLAASTWAKKNYRGTSAAETRDMILREATPVTLNAEMSSFAVKPSEPSFVLAAEEGVSAKSWLGLGGLLIGSGVLAYVLGRR